MQQGGIGLGTRAAAETAALVTRDRKRYGVQRHTWRSYGGLQLAVGDRVICRRNDRTVDVDNGMRGTVRHLDGDRVIVDTDGGLVRELPAATWQSRSSMPTR